MREFLAMICFLCSILFALFFFWNGSCRSVSMLNQTLSLMTEQTLDNDTGQHLDTTNIVINGRAYALSNTCDIDEHTNLMWIRSVPDADIIGDAGKEDIL